MFFFIEQKIFEYKSSLFNTNAFNEYKYLFLNLKYFSLNINILYWIQINFIEYKCIFLKSKFFHEYIELSMEYKNAFLLQISKLSLRGFLGILLTIQQVILERL